MADFLPPQHNDSSPHESTVKFGDNTTKIIQLPSNSFTAFRLSYATSTEISHLASTVFLGKVPDAWTKLSNKLAIFSKRVTPVPSARRWVSSTATGLKIRLSKYARFGNSGHDTMTSPSIMAQYTLDQHDVSPENWDGSSTESSYLDECEILEYAAESEQALNESKHLSGIVYGIADHPINLQDEKELSYHGYEIGSKESHSDPSLSRLSPAEKMRPVTLKVNQTSGGRPELSLKLDSSVLRCEPGRRAPQINSHPSNSASDSTDNIFLKTSPQENPLSSLKKNMGESFPVENRVDNTDLKKPRVQFANPLPEEKTATDHLRKEYIKAEREHYRAIRKMQSLAHKSKGKARLSTSKLKLKVVDNIFRKHKAGDVIRVDKMLVMIKKTCNISNRSNFEEKDHSNAFIQDHWREYYVVLRKTGDSLDSLRIQFFETNKGKYFEGKPEYFLDLSKRTKLGFFSHTDKTISISDNVDSGSKIFIMNAKYSTVAYRWLYMIKEVLDDDFFSTLKIHLSGESFQVRINIPNDVLKKSLSNSNSMILSEQSIGYTVKTDVLSTYLRSKIDSHLKFVSNRHGKADDWIKSNPNPAFCFKFYDRIEWVPNNGKSLMVQSQLLREEAILEYRQVTKTPLSIENSKGEMIGRPLQIEGFLSRITHTSGKKVSKFRAFYKIQYFFSSENILFFSSLFRGIPPSPHNELLKDDADKQSLCQLLPDIYLKNPFELDSREHIKWLLGTEFEKFDKEAIEEFSRKLQQIVGARAMLDISLISAVRPIPFESIHTRHLYFQLYLWYSSPKILEDMSIMDSGFEIELFDGSQLKLLAPLKVVRDEWVERLNNLAVYWRSQMTYLAKVETFRKLKNMENLRLEDYVDSNLSFGPDSLEIKKSVANVNAFTASGLAMSTCILCSGYLYQKQKKHSNFSRYFVVLCPGYLLVFSIFKRSKVKGIWKDTPYFERYMTIPISECYVHSGTSTQLDLVGSQKVKTPGECNLPRVYPDGWRSSEEEFMRCFSIWFGGKRALRHGVRFLGLNTVQGSLVPKNPGMVRMACKLGVTGKILVFLARSRQEREYWVYNILQEINRFSGD